MDNSNNNQYEHVWSVAYLIDNIFNDLMGKSIEDKNGKKINKYINQAVTKFNDFRRKSSVTFFDIFNEDLSDETKKHLNDYVKDCSSERKIYQKLNGIMTEVIALIYKQAESLILSTLEYEDLAWVKKAINEIRERIKNKWRFVKTDVCC